MKPLSAYGDRARSRLRARYPGRWCSATDYREPHDYRRITEDRGQVSWTEACSRCRRSVVIDIYGDDDDAY